MGIILVGAAELFIEVVEARNRECGAYDMMCGGDELCQAQHNCDNISFEVSEVGELCQAQSEDDDKQNGDKEGLQEVVDDVSGQVVDCINVRLCEQCSY